MSSFTSSRTFSADQSTLRFGPSNTTRTTTAAAAPQTCWRSRCESSSAAEDSGITNFRETQVTVHALATIKSLGDFLRPRLSIPVTELGSRSHRDSPFRREFPTALAAYAAAIHRRDPASFPPIPAPSDITTGSSQSGRRFENAENTESPAAPSASAPVDAPTSLRRSRRHAQPPLPPPAKDEGETLECADEKQISSDEEMDEEAALNAIVGRLEEEMEDEEPSAVNLEVAPTGKVTARKDDGTRVSTPGATPTSTGGTRAASSPRTQGTPHRHMNLARSLSYAAAMASTPQDWHIEFSINGQPITQDSTVYRVVHFSQAQPNDVSARSLLSSTHTIKFKKVSGPPPQEPTTLTQLTQFTQPTESGLPASLTGNPTTATILRLLSLLHGLNSNLEDVVVENKDSEKLVAEPLSQFVNTKLTAKLNRQLEEPLIVASGCLPTWSEDLARLYPFLFPFETRHLFLQSTSFGFARSMTRWQHEQSTNDSRSDRLRDERQYLGRLQRQKVRISRGKILESAIKVMDLYGASPAILEVEFFDEVGTGLGPTLEFYSTVSREFAREEIEAVEKENEVRRQERVRLRSTWSVPRADERGIRQLGEWQEASRSLQDSRQICGAVDAGFENH